MPPVGIEPGSHITFDSLVQPAPYSATEAIACKAKTCGSLYSHALLIVPESASPKIKWCMNRNLKISSVAHDSVAQKGACWT